MSAIEKLLSLARTLGAMPYYALRKITMLSKRIPLYTQIKINKYKRLGNPVIRHQIDLRQAFLWLGLGTILSHPLQGLAQPSAITLQQLIAQNAIDEWISFNAPNRPMVQSLDDVSRLEKNPMEYRKCLRINQFWAAVPANNVKPPRGDSCALNIPPTPQGKGQARKWDDFPWSAAFISFIMQESGAGNTFKRSGRHATYIVDSVKNKDTANYPFRGYRINERRPEIGDLICAPRGKENTNLTYDMIVRTGDFKSHCDIVVAINTNSTIEVIGGNVGDTVAKTIVALNRDGYVDEADKSFRKWFVLIKNDMHP
jgi:hypothetical protein